MSLYDRDYYRRQTGSEERGGFTVLLWLIGLNLLIFLLARGGGGGDGMLELCSSPQEFAPWQLLTYAFLHADFTHLLFNMWGLYIFGTLVTPHLGGRNFLLL